MKETEYPNCPECDESMEYVLQIDSDDNLDYIFGDAGCSHITQCKTHADERYLLFGHVVNFIGDITKLTPVMNGKPALFSVPPRSLSLT